MYSFMPLKDHRFIEFSAGIEKVQPFGLDYGIKKAKKHLTFFN